MHINNSDGETNSNSYRLHSNITWLFSLDSIYDRTPIEVPGLSGIWRTTSRLYDQDEYDYVWLYHYVYI